MPFTRTRRRYRPRRPRRNFGLATKPVMIPRTLAIKRHNQVSTKVFYFKDNGKVVADLGGHAIVGWSAQDILNVAQWTSITGLYDQYKVIGMTVKIFPANVGTEGHETLFGQDFTLNRGDAIVWSDQRPGDTTQIPQFIEDSINNASCKMINPRRPYKRSIFRAKGFSEWGGLEATTQPDSWKGNVYLVQNNTTPAVVGPPSSYEPLLWYWTRLFKVVVRGRRQS